MTVLSIVTKATLALYSGVNAATDFNVPLLPTPHIVFTHSLSPAILLTCRVQASLSLALNGSR